MLCLTHNIHLQMLLLSTHVSVYTIILYKMFRKRCLSDNVTGTSDHALLNLINYLYKEVYVIVCHIVMSLYNYSIAVVYHYIRS